MALVILVAVLMGLHAIGAYGFLAKAHIGHAVDGDVAAAGKVADIEAKLSVQARIVAGIDRQIAEISSAVSRATEKGRTAAAMRLVPVVALLLDPAAVLLLLAATGARQ